MEFGILGPLEVRCAGRPVEVAGAKPRAVLAMLLLHANQPVSAERLARGLWGEDAPGGAVRTVQVHLSRLRRALPDTDVVVTTPAGYRLRVAPGRLDAAQFGHLVAEGRRALADDRPQIAGDVLREALALWRGPALADMASEPFAQAEIARLEEQRLEAEELRVQADLAMGRHAQLIGELQSLVAAHPLREGLHAHLMLALYRAGRQADALAAYQQARGVLVERLGIEPGRELRDLEHAILAHDPELTASRDSAGAPRAPVQVPRPPTPTIGRDADVAEVAEMLRDRTSRLVTITGPGGVGKTRLAIEVARLGGPEVRDDACFVALEGLQSAALVAGAIARELGLTSASDTELEDAVVRHLRERRLLLVLDNFEHVLDAAPWVAELLARTEGPIVLATSREPLRLRAERLFRLDPLPVPGTGSSPEPAPSVALFVSLARARDPAFRLTDQTAPAVAEICRRLDGLPLAIELAAARLELLSPPELAARLGEGIGPGPRDAPARHRTLTATLEWSHALLSPAEQRAFAAMSVFAGGCALDSAQQVADSGLEVLEALVAKHLLVRRPPARLAMLETVRAFARDRLDELPDGDAVRRRHCEHYLAFAQAAKPALEWAGAPALLAEHDREIDNFRAALSWALDHAPVLALQLGSALTAYWTVRATREEAARWISAGLSAAGDDVPDPVRADALTTLALSMEGDRTVVEAEAAATESLALHRAAGDLRGCARSAALLAWVAVRAHRPDEANRRARRALALALEADDEQSAVWARQTMALTAPGLGEALRLGEEVIASLRAAGNLHQLAGFQTSLAYAALMHGEHEAALRLSTEALSAAQGHDEPHLVALTQGNAGLAALFAGRLDQAHAAFLRELRLVDVHGYDAFLYEALSGLAAVAAGQGEDRVAATLCGAADTTAFERNDPSIARQLDERFFAPARRRCGEPGWQAAYTTGAGFGRREAIDAALRSLRLHAAA